MCRGQEGGGPGGPDRSGSPKPMRHGPWPGFAPRVRVDAARSCTTSSRALPSPCPLRGRSEVIGLEAVAARWQQPNGAVAADRLPCSWRRRRGLIVRSGAWCAGKRARQTASWVAESDDQVPLSVAVQPLGRQSMTSNLVADGRGPRLGELSGLRSVAAVLESPRVDAHERPGDTRRNVLQRLAGRGAGRIDDSARSVVGSRISVVAAIAHR